ARAVSACDRCARHGAGRSAAAVGAALGGADRARGRVAGAAGGDARRCGEEDRGRQRPGQQGGKEEGRRMTTVLLIITYAFFAVAALLTVWRIIRGPSIL